MLVFMTLVFSYSPCTVTHPNKNGSHPQSGGGYYDNELTVTDEED